MLKNEAFDVHEPCPDGPPRAFLLGTHVSVVLCVHGVNKSISAGHAADSERFTGNAPHFAARYRPGAAGGYESLVDIRDIHDAEPRIFWQLCFFSFRLLVAVVAELRGSSSGFRHADCGFSSGALGKPTKPPNANL